MAVMGGVGEYRSNSLGYKFSWFLRGVLVNTTTHQMRTIPAGATQPHFISPVYAFVGYPNGATLWYGIEGETVLWGDVEESDVLQVCEGVGVEGGDR